MYQIIIFFGYFSFRDCTEMYLLVHCGLFFFFFFFFNNNFNQPYISDELVLVQSIIP